jgi:hypothetical protein
MPNASAAHKQATALPGRQVASHSAVAAASSSWPHPNTNHVHCIFGHQPKPYLCPGPLPNLTRVCQAQHCSTVHPLAPR